MFNVITFLGESPCTGHHGGFEKSFINKLSLFRHAFPKLFGHGMKQK